LARVPNHFNQMKAPGRTATSVPPRGEASDVEVVAALARGEVWAADALYERIAQPVDRTLRRLLRTLGSEHDDLVQSVFERILRVLTERSLTLTYDLPAWASVVALRVGLDALRRRGREGRLFQALPDEIDVHEPGLDRRVEARSDLLRVQRVVAKMKSKYSETVLLHDVLGHDLAEVADLTGVSVAAAQSRLVRGRKDLMRRMAAEKR
jgi:RNA polymerase sigma-70 factor (ECF subfamily)